ncbi:MULTISPECIES: glycogen debranching N-terminal domain-containing protein [unclassified Microcoleus]
MVTDSDGSIDHRRIQGFFVRDTRPLFFYNIS